MMKKLKWFTLVEILIVIVIIGILIAALLPRMSTAQGRARDVARKNDLSQIQTALVAYNGDHGHYPATNNWVPVSTLGNVLYEAWFSEIPRDPQKQATIEWIYGSYLYPGEYWYKSMTKNWVENGWFVLAAHMEIPWSANYVLGSESFLMGAISLEDFNRFPYISFLDLKGWLFKVYADSKADGKIDNKELENELNDLNKKFKEKCGENLDKCGLYTDVTGIIYCDSIKEGGDGNEDGQHDKSDCSYEEGDQDNMLVYVLAY